MHCVSTCKILIPAFSTSPGPRQEEEVLHAAREIERLSAEVSFFPSVGSGRLRSASEPAFPSTARVEGMEQEGCDVRSATSNNVVGDWRHRAWLGGRTLTTPDPSDLSLRFSSHDMPRASSFGKSLSPAITFLPRSYSFPPIHCVPTTSRDDSNPERTQDSFPVYSPPNPTDLARLRFPAAFILHADKTPPLDHHPNAWLSPKSFALNSPPSPCPRIHPSTEDSPTQRMAIRRKPVPKLLAEDPVRNSSFMRFSTMNSFPLLHPTDALKPSPSVVAKAFRRSDRVKGYSLRYFLSQGAQGKVYLATCGGEQELSAIKVISKLTVESFRTLLQEQKLLKRIKGHQFVLNMVDSFHDTENFYLVTDYYPGGDLAHLLYKVGIFETDMARFYISELVVAVKFLHDRGIVHRDLKPGNILIKSDGHICVVDFGLCKDFKSTSTSRRGADRLSHESKPRLPWPTTNGFAGTLVYMSPQAVNQDPYSYETDWWAVGIILYELLQGDTPWVGSDIPSMVKKIRRDPLVFRKDVQVDSAARDFIEKLLEKEVDARIPPSQFESHIFFQSATFADIERGLLIPPFTPQYSEKLLASGCLNETDKIYVGRPYDPTVDPFPEYNYVDSLSDSLPPVDGLEAVKMDVGQGVKKFSTRPRFLLDTLAPRPRLRRGQPYTKPEHLSKASSDKGPMIHKLNLPIDNTFGPVLPNPDKRGSTEVSKASRLPKVTSSLLRLSAAFSRSFLYSEHFSGTSTLGEPAPAVAISPPRLNLTPGFPPSSQPIRQLVSPAPPSNQTPFTPKLARPTVLPLHTPSLTPPLPSMLTVSSIRAASSLFSVNADGSATHTTLVSSYTTSVLADISSVSAASSPASQEISGGNDVKKPTASSPLLDPNCHWKTYEARRIGAPARGPVCTTRTSDASTGFAKWFAVVTRSVLGLMRRIESRLRRSSAHVETDLTV